MPSLADKLKSLGVKTGATHLPAPQPKGDQFDIASVLSGTIISTGLGETFIHEERFKADYRHGHAPIQLQTSLEMISAWAADPRFHDLPIESFEFLYT